MFLQKSLKLKLNLIIVIVMLLPLLITNSIIIKRVIDNTHQSINREQKQMLNNVKSQLEIIINDTESLMKMVADNEVIKGMNPNFEMGRLLKGVVEEYDAIPNISVLNKEGKQIYKVIGQLGDRNDREYYKQGIRGEVYYSKVIYSRSRHVPTVILAIPIKNEGQVVGVIATELDLSFLRALASQIKFRESEYLYIVSEDGRTIYHPDKSLVEDMYDASHLAPVKEVMQGREGVVEYVYEGVDKIVAYAPVPKVRWGLGITIEDKVVHSEIARETNKVIYALLISLLIAIVLGYFLANHIVTPISKSIHFAQKIADGELTNNNLKINSQDEIGNLAQALNIMKSNLREVIINLRNSVEHLSSYSQELSASAEEGSAIVSNTSDRINDIVVDIEQISASSQETASLAQVASNKSEENSMNVKDTMSKTVEIIKDLNNSSNQIGKVVELITNIAEQINLLALNAAIEAARAGEAGRGFAVVADEIRGLAEQTAKSTEDIKNLINTIQKKAKLGLSSVEHVLEETEELFVEIKENGEKTVEHINEVAISAQNLAQNSDDLSNSSLEMGKVSEEIATSSQELAHMSQRLQQMVEKFKV
ncbi:methyl-accepting chemotaxis sensory transducer with Cache sensor [Orenia metallireducens]|uniref:Methyl-accepting chemotaxis sensory transducer with Cache sensor n=1 Tax=Orenia metallireducens TaxID=1413210 RepID=A0A285H522_9FIRM|nr:methyl-accepting chemotaxis protein [Orenia metallireducens]PRX28617.1 methyl-accepting chemotaxis sensory transducer with Cache sensor [Orenia metallireducens]SNY30815.1 methyl-accepting chemotaxis sensory transducer with Cache sensor [Orenia metallireducens]